MMTLEASEQYAPESDAPFGSLSAAAANHRSHHATHARSRCVVEFDLDGRALEPGLRRPGEGERGLMRAVLTDAIKCLGGGGREGQLLKAEARRWLASRDLLWPFSFENICLALDLDAPTLRRRLGIQPLSMPPRVNGTAAAHPGGNRAPVQGRGTGEEAASSAAHTPRAAGARPAHSTDEGPSVGLEAVTAREREIIRQVAFGLRNAEVATKLHISRRTVTTHLANIFRKLGIHQRGELLGFALRTAIV
jgi:DNA-binding CsgD family transcriptional regulator